MLEIEEICTFHNVAIVFKVGKISRWKMGKIQREKNDLLRRRKLVMSEERIIIDQNRTE